jgi:hypothetical protein
MSRAEDDAAWARLVVRRAEDDAAWARLVDGEAPAIELVMRAARTYPDDDARQELLDRLNTRWIDGDTPPARARYY